MGIVASMTGYGRAAAVGGRREFVVEARSLNHRFLEIAVKLPRGLSGSEAETRRRVQGRLTRGRVDVTVVTRGVSGSATTVRTDIPLAQEYLRSARLLRDEVGVTGELTLAELCRLPGVVVLEDLAADEDAAAGGALQEALEGALDELVHMRRTEGAALKGELAGHLTTLEAWTRDLQGDLPGALQRIRERARSRIEGMLEDVPVDPARILQEAATWAARSDVAEEIARLGMHGAQFRGLLDAGGAIGRRLDFLAQELHREVNTIAAKVDDIRLITGVLDGRAVVERIREQVQNIE